MSILLLSWGHRDKGTEGTDGTEASSPVSFALMPATPLRPRSGANKPLARLEGSIAFTTLLTRLPNLRLAVPRDSLTWQFNLNSRSLTALPVAF